MNDQKKEELLKQYSKEVYGRECKLSREEWDALSNLIDTILADKTKKIKKALLEKARQTDYADRTEYDEAYEIVITILKE